MSAQTIDWEKYQQLPPDQRRRPLTSAEYAALTKQQRIAGGLEDDDQGAPANFNGPVFPNPTHIQPRADTDPAIDPTRLPQGVSFQSGNWSGTPQMDVSNPAAADVQPEMGREVGADFGDGKKMSAQPIDFSKYEPGAPPGGQQIDFSKYEQGTTKTQQDASSIDERDRATTEAWAQNHPILGPIARFLVAGGQNAGHAITDTPGQLYHAIVDPPTLEESELGLKPEQRIAYRLGLKQAIEAGTDYASGKVTLKGAASVLPEALGTGVGQVAGGAVYGKTGEIAGKVLSKVAPGAVKPTLAKIGNAATAVGESLDPDVVGLVSPRAAHALRVAQKVGKVASTLGAEAEVAPELDATGENKPFAGEPPPKAAPVLDATGENKPFAGGMDEYVPPKPKAPRTIVTAPQTGRPEFPDVVATKQQTAAPVETKPAIPETQTAPSGTPTPQPAAKGTPAETPGPAADDLLERLKGVADRIQKQETSAPGSADEDLVQQAQDSLDMVRARKAAGITRAPETAAGTEQEFKQRLSAIADRKAAQAAGKSPGVASSGANGLQPSAGGAIPKYVYRVRDVGESGVPANGWANTSLEEAQSHLPGREDVQGKPQEIVRIDTSKLDPAHYTFTPGPGAHDWVKFKFAAPERVISPAGAGATKVQ